MGYLPEYQAEVVPTNPRDNLVSTVDTINKMIVLVNESVGSPIVIQTAMQIVAGIGKHSANEMDLIRGVFWWCKHHVMFKEDEAALMQDFGVENLGTGKELLLSPPYLLGMPQPTGDCDDFSTLICTLLKCMGFKRVGFRTIAADSLDPRCFTHVYVIVQLQDGRFYPIDGSHGPYPGWESEVIYKKHDWWIM